MRRLALTALAACLASGTASGAPFTRQARVVPVEAGPSAPIDLARPEGKSRWDLTGVRPVGDGAVRTLVESGRLVTVDGAEIGDPSGGDAAIRWRLPDRAGPGLRMGTRDRYQVTVRRGPAVETLSVETEIVGIGWIHLPSRPREVVLQRAIVSAGGAAPTTVHRWIDPRAGIVAEASADSAEIVSEVLTGAADLKVYSQQLVRPSFTRLLYGWDRGAGTPISALVPNPGVTTAGQLIALNTWDFSGNASGIEIAQTDTNVTAAETCNAPQCGYNIPGAQLGRQDRNFPNPGSLRRDNQVVETENRAGDVTVWLRAGAQFEGVSGLFNDGESRFCWVSTSGRTRNPVPLWRFAHQDAGGWYMTSGDLWEGGPLNSCQQTLFRTVCGADPILPPKELWIKSCDTSTSDPHYGKQSGEVLKGGVVILPSGHTLNALLVRTVADFCVYSDSICFVKFDEVRTVIYLWEVPSLGTVGFLQSAQDVPDLTSFTTVDSTNMKFGLFPPVSITAGGTTDTTLTVSWNPGNDTHRLSGYKVYWDTDSGAATPYAFNSATHPGQVTFGANTATISGLQSGTTYYVTVTSLSDFTDPSTNVVTRYESILYPTQVSGDPAFVYPVEVQATTASGTCIPTAEVASLTVGKTGGQIQVCWSAASDPCLAGYDVLGAASPAASGNFSVVGQTDAATTCWTGSPSEGYFLVVVRGTGGSGPWGHYGK